MSVYAPSAVKITDSTGKSNDPALTLNATVITSINPVVVAPVVTTPVVTTPVVTTPVVTTPVVTTPVVTTPVVVTPVVNPTVIPTNPYTVVFTPVPVVEDTPTVIKAMNATETLAALKKALAVAVKTEAKNIYAVTYGAPYTLY